ncbi:hypothetical protein ANN_15464 [Periplaneta americana]|uniref:Per a allergen n=1 Tax=Periplaneta americana TaxID=6978 RepID=A0ABQ8SHS8_PERAM|nr:hypothetical protein ANN_15464 [Periplaneta americana]
MTGLCEGGNEPPGSLKANMIRLEGYEVTEELPLEVNEQRKSRIIEIREVSGHVSSSKKVILRVRVQAVNFSEEHRTIIQSGGIDYQFWNGRQQSTKCNSASRAIDVASADSLGCCSGAAFGLGLDPPLDFGFFLGFPQPWD